MRILFTGGSGFIGQCFINQFSDHQYVVLTRNASATRALFNQHSNVEVITSLQELEHLNDFDAVINLAGEPIIDQRWSEKQKHRIASSRWDTTDQIVQLIKASDVPPKVFLSGSAIGIYGDQGEQILDEHFDSETTDFSSTLCREWEARARQAEACCRVIYLRTGVVLHPKHGALQRMLLPFKLGLGGRLASGEHYFSWIHWQDMVNAMNFLLNSESLSGAFNMTAPNPVTNKVFTKVLGRSLHRPTIFPVPAITLKLALGEASQLLLISQRVVPKALLNAGYEFRYSGIQEATDSLLRTD